MSSADRSRCLAALYPRGQDAILTGRRPPDAIKNPAKKYACAVCKVSFDLYGLFIHMKEVRRN